MGGTESQMATQLRWVLGRETPQVRRALAPGRGISAHQGVHLTYLSLLPVEGPENGKKQ